MDRYMYYSAVKRSLYPLMQVTFGWVYYIYIYIYIYIHVLYSMLMNRKKTAWLKSTNYVPFDRHTTSLTVNIVEHLAHTFRFILGKLEDRGFLEELASVLLCSKPYYMSTFTRSGTRQSPFKSLAVFVHVA